MAKYTLTLQEICNYLYTNDEKTIADLPIQNTWAGGFDPNVVNPFDETVDEDVIIQNALPKIFDFDLALYDKKHLPELETKIIKHYYMQEIGFETYGRWKFALEERLNLILPFYNEIYKTIEMQGDNPLVNNDIFETRNTTGSGSNTSENKTVDNGNNRQVVQNTPTSQIGNTDYASNIVDNIMDNTTTNNGSGSNQTKEDMERHLTGLSNYSKQDMIARYRENIVNVDEAIVNELFDLFMLIY